MCTLIAFHRVWNDWPLVVATNRDEAYDRPSASPRRVAGVLAPRDEVAGGTWMGANDRGVWVGITNRHQGDVDPDRRSRGLLCRELLSAASAAEAADRVAALEEPYNPFHLVAGDGVELRYVEYEVGRVDARRLEPGAHVVTNRPLDETAGEPKAARARWLLAQEGLGSAAPEGPSPPDLESRLARVLADHGAEGPDALCMHGGRYGTRSAGIWRLRPGPAGAAAEVRLAFADGPPCSVPFRPIA